MKSNLGLEKKLEEKEESREEIELILFPLIKEELIGYADYLFNLLKCIQQYFPPRQLSYMGYIGGSWKESHGEHSEIIADRDRIAIRKENLKNAKSMKEAKEEYYQLRELQFKWFKKYSSPDLPVECIREIVKRKGIDRIYPDELDPNAIEDIMREEEKNKYKLGLDEIL